MSAAHNQRFDVFLSYGHSDTAVALQLVERLEAHGYKVFWDSLFRSGDDWRNGIRKKIQQSRKVLVLWSRGALFAPDGREKDWIKYEAALAHGLGRYVPFTLDVRPEDLPSTLTDRQARPLPDLEQGFDEICSALGPPHSRPREVNELAHARDRISLSSIPMTSGPLVGRDDELAILKSAWKAVARGKSTDKTNVVVFHAMGGAGKTALLRGFISLLAEKGFSGADKVLGWSAYSQGQGRNTGVGIETFFVDALDFLGYRGPELTEPIERARALTRLLRAQKVLLILDGLEPLQDLPDVRRGRLRHDGLARIITDLAYENPGLLILTSRQPLYELQQFERPAVVNHALDKLSPKQGALLFQHLGISGSRHELHRAAAELQGHALSIVLLSKFLETLEDGNIARRERFRFGEIVDTAADLGAADQTDRLAKRSQRIIQEAIDRFQAMASSDSAGQGRIELALLHILGLFDRPIEPGALDALFATPEIPGITISLTSGNLSPQQRSARLRYAKRRLRVLGLLSEPNPDAPDDIDAHPIVRSYFDQHLRTTKMDGFRAAHDRLGHYYESQASSDPKTLADLAPLFKAVRHFALAGKGEYAFSSIYWSRIQSKRAYVAMRTFGAYGACLEALMHFFDPPWSAIGAKLNGAFERSNLFNQAAFALQALGRPADAIEPYGQAVAIAESAGLEEFACRNASNLSGVQLLVGNINDAIASAQNAVRLANLHLLKDQDSPVKATALARLADALYLAGQIRRAVRHVRDAVHWAKNHSAAFTLANRVSLAIYAGAGNWDEIEREIATIGATSGTRTSADPAAEGFNAVALGKAQLGKGNYRDAAKSFDDAVRLMRNSSREEFLPAALVARVEFSLYRARSCLDSADYRRAISSLTAAAADLLEVEEIADRSQLRLVMADHHIQYARSAGLAALLLRRRTHMSELRTLIKALRISDRAAAAKALAINHLTEARSLIEQTGYDRARRTLEDVATELERQ